MTRASLHAASAAEATTAGALRYIAPSISELVPNGRRFNFYGLAVAPQIGWVRNLTNGIMRRYEAHAPGSHEALALLHSMADECRALIKQLLLDPADGEGCRMEFCSGTSRAMEIALARTGRPEKIIVSPFEHPSVSAVARWFASVAGSDVSHLHFDPRDFFRPWREQEDKLVAQITEETEGCKATAALILSEVTYATGLVIPAEAVMRRLARGAADSRLRVVLDGAHAAGNDHHPRGIRECASYVISAHKWMLAPEPCGIILTHRPVSGAEVPYDAWGQTLPASTANVSMVAGLLGSLRFLTTVGLENLRAHSRRLREQFAARMRSHFMAVGEGTGLAGTLMLAVCPRPNRRWKYGARELSAYLEENSIHALVLTTDPDVPWVRIAFPCFIEYQHVDALCDVLESALA